MLKEQIAQELYPGDSEKQEVFMNGWDHGVDISAHELHIVPRDPLKLWQWDSVDYVMIDPDSIKRLKEV